MNEVTNGVGMSLLLRLVEASGSNMGPETSHIAESFLLVFLIVPQSRPWRPFSTPIILPAVRGNIVFKYLTGSLHDIHVHKLINKYIN
jgi:hypothetical protein